MNYLIIHQHFNKPNVDKLLSAQRVCEVIEGLIIAIDNQYINKDDIYKLVHMANKNCRNNHPEWIKEYLKLESKLVRENIIGKVD